MITNFLSTNKNILSDYIENKNKVNFKAANKIKDKQDAILDNFFTSSINNIYKNVKLNKEVSKVNLFLPITNEIWNLWNNAWSLGSKHAYEEIKVNFNLSSRSIVTFEKGDREINKLLQDISTLEKQNQYLESNLNRMNYQDMRSSERVIERNKITIERKQVKLIQLRREQSSQNDLPKIKRNIIGTSKEDEIKAINEISKRSSREASISTNLGITPLQQTEFGKEYLNNRINYLGNNLKEEYKLTLLGENGLINNYFKSKNPLKDRILYKGLEQVILNKQLDNNPEALESKLNLLNNKIKSVGTKRDYYDSLEQRTLESIYDNPNTTNKEKEKQERLLRISINKELKKEFNPIISLSNEEKTLLKLDLSKEYSLNDLKKIKEQATKETSVANKIKRLALTELGHAYNLGRLSVFDAEGIELVRLNNSLEHLRRSIPNKYKSIYRKKASQIEGGFPFKIKGVVCPVCQERAERENGYGKGIYELKKVLKNRQLQLVFHPYCACYYEPVDGDAKKGGIKIKIDSFFDNNLALWASGGTLAGGILGTAIMYTMFARTRVKKTSSQPLVKIAKTILDEVIENVPKLNVPLFIKLPDKQPIELSPEQVNELENSISPVKQSINNAIKETITEISNANKINPNIKPGLQERINSIMSRLETYDNYNPTLLTNSERKQIISQYNTDLRLINNLLNKLEKSNINLYLKYLNSYNKRLDGLTTLRRSVLNNVPDNVELEDYLNSTPTIRRLNKTIEDIEDTLRNNYNLIENNFDDNLTNIRNNLITNPQLTQEFIKSSRKTIENNFNRINNNNNLNNLLNEVNSIDDILSSSQSISENRFRQLLYDLDTINYLISNNFKVINNLDIIDLDYITSLNINQLGYETTLIGKAQALKDYTNGLSELSKRLFIVTNKLISKQK